MQARPILIARESALFEPVQRMHATAKLNPYQREVLYGYPFVIGRQNRQLVRGPLLTVPVQVEPRGSGFLVHPADEFVRFNSLPFRSENETAVHELAIARVIEATPPFPVGISELKDFVEVLSREFSTLHIDARLDGQLADPPEEPTRNEDHLLLIDQAALFIAPKSSYFLTSDLDQITAVEQVNEAALVALLAGAGEEPPVDLSPDELDGATVYYPFPSNRSQRTVALLLDDPTTRVVRVEGPPGTGKSLTIANLACHLAATGRTALITSQKDKALQVVDAKLRELNLDQLPMTLLRQDRESKRDLLARLDRIRKERGMDEVVAEHEQVQEAFEQAVTAYLDQRAAYADALSWEERVELAHRRMSVAKGIRRLARSFRFRRILSKANRRAPQSTDEAADRASRVRAELRGLAVTTLLAGMERAVASAPRIERQHLRELSAVLKRDQTKYRNFSLFDRLKDHPDWAGNLLKLLPVWLLAPDDAARLFPCRPGLFDIVIVDEASQVDLPSITPIIYRGKKVVIFGDTKQMQPRRFAFMSQQVAIEAWQRYGLDKHDPNQWLHPSKQSLLNLAAIRAEEELLLDEHFRSLPGIIEFSNNRWYDGRLRIMTDERGKRFGGPAQPVIELHYVPDGEISNGSQENEREAHALVEFLGQLVGHPDYVAASIGVLCLFEEQVALVQEIIADAIDPAEWEEHNIVVVNPDGFQGDERDVILYSLSWDNKIMPRQALSARQEDAPHIQGMLNVAFTRARDEIHVFHSAPINTFTFAGGRPGALTEWLQHCASVERRPRTHPSGSRVGRVDSEFEADVGGALRERGLLVLHQYPVCGFRIDLVCELDGRRIAVECDGERYHRDEHGRLRIEDIERQAVLERAGWRVVRIPYRKWLGNPEAEIQKVLEAIGGDPPGSVGTPLHVAEGLVPAEHSKVFRVTRGESAILEAVKTGLSDEEHILRYARQLLGFRRLGRLIREDLLFAVRELNHKGLLAIEDHEYFLTVQGRGARVEVVEGIRRPAVTSASRGRRKSSRRTSSSHRPYRRSRYRRRYY